MRGGVQDAADQMVQIARDTNSSESGKETSAAWLSRVVVPDKVCTLNACCFLVNNNQGFAYSNFKFVNIKVSAKRTPSDALMSNDMASLFTF